jgi:hypothetical protein
MALDSDVLDAGLAVGSAHLAERWVAGAQNADQLSARGEPGLGPARRRADGSM